MNTMANETQDPDASPSEGAPGGPPSAKVADLQAQIEGSRAAAMDEGEGSRKAAADPLSGPVTVNWGGTNRTVNMDDLVKAAMEREELTQMKSHVDSQMEDMAALRMLGNQIEGMTPEQVQALQSFLQNPDRLTAPPNGETRKSSDVGDDIDELLSGQKPVDNTLKTLMETVERQGKTLSAIGNYLEGDLAQKRSVSLAERVQTEMNSFDVFKEVEGADGFAKRSILNAIAANPKADVGNVVADHATQLHKMIAKSREGVVAERVGRAATPLPTPVPEGWKPNADSLMDKSLLRQAQRRLDELG